jgi:two-component system LytT family sensor kinase
MRERSKPLFDWDRDWYVVGLWPMIGSLAVFIQILSLLAQGRSLDPMRHLSALVPWFGWSLLAPLMIAMGRRFRFDGGSSRTVSIVAHVVAVLVFAVAHSTLVYSARFLLTGEIVPGGGSLRSDLVERLPVHFMFDLLVYLSTLLTVYTSDLTHRIEDDATGTAKLEAALAQAELELMTTQVQPVFILSTLHLIRSLLGSDPPRAEKMLGRLSELLRLTLDNVGAETVPLRDELEFLRRFFEIEANRQPQRVDLTVRASEEVQETLIPNLLLQDLVIAWIHPLAARSSVALSIDAELLGDRLLLLITASSGDEVRHLPERDALERTGARLQRVAGDRWNLVVDHAAPLPTVRIELPVATSEVGGAAVLAFDGGRVARVR